MRFARLPRVAAVSVLAVVACLAGCSGSPAPGDGSASPSAPATTSAADPSGTPTTPSASPSGSASPSLATLPAKQCLDGTWTLVRFVATSNQTYGTGQGGDVTVAFDDGRYTLRGAGKEPIEITLAGSTGALRVDGQATGTSRLDGSTATFTSGSATGSGTVTLAGREQRLTMKQVTSVVGLQGKGEVACTAEAMTITFTTVRLELART